MKAYELLSKPGAWTQHRLALDSKNCAVDARSARAVKFCAEGAIIRCYSNVRTQDAMEQRLALAINNCISRWNDDPMRTQKEVAAKLKQLDI